MLIPSDNLNKFSRRLPITSEISVRGLRFVAYNGANLFAIPLKNLYLNIKTKKQQIV
jgi:hypothetical protein